MKTLFAKIFPWFWASLALLILVAFWMPHLSERKAQTMFPGNNGPGNRLADDAREAMEHGGRAGLVAFLERLDHPGFPPVYAIDAQGRELRGKQPSDEVVSLAQAAVGKGRPLVKNLQGRLLLAYPLATTSGADSCALILSLRPPPHRPFWPPPDAGIIIVLMATGGALCYGLARHLSAPVSRLHQAVSRLASGDLSARVARAAAAPGDELASLERDFNLMAERLELLVLSHQRLLRDVSHELRSPLARIRVAMALAEQNQGEQRDPLFDRIEREAERLEILVTQILTLSRLEAQGGAMVQAEPMELGALVRAVVEDADFEAGLTGACVRLSDCGPIPMEGDPSLLCRAVENVVRNAVRVTPRGEQVDVELTTSSEAGSTVARIAVLDRGPGVAPSELEAIFQPFTRGEEARDRRTGGPGLGLAIARRAVEAHGGSIRAHLRADGGLVVEMLLPLTFSTPNPARERAA